MPDPTDKLLANLRDVSALGAMNGVLLSARMVPRSDIGVLNRSAIVLACACWEAFIEDCAAEAFDFLIATVREPGRLPTGLRRSIANDLKSDKNELAAWQLAGNGWREVARAYRDRQLRRHIGAFNTPRAGNIDALFEALLDIPSISNQWKGKNFSAAMARRRLDSLVTLRGAIAHRVRPDQSVTLRQVDAAPMLIIRIAVHTVGSVQRHLRGVTGRDAWPDKSRESDDNTSEA